MDERCCGERQITSWDAIRKNGLEISRNILRLNTADCIQVSTRDFTAGKPVSNTIWWCHRAVHFEMCGCAPWGRIRCISAAVAISFFEHTDGKSSCTARKSIRATVAQKLTLRAVTNYSRPM